MVDRHDQPVIHSPPLPRDIYEAALAQALADSAREGERGRAVTPFLLERIRVLTGDRSAATNRALLVDNARVGAELAGALSALARPSLSGWCYGYGVCVLALTCSLKRARQARAAPRSSRYSASPRIAANIGSVSMAAAAQ
jgi:hypothetical protein